MVHDAPTPDLPDLPGLPDKILVTGANGRVGRGVVADLRGRGREVVAVDRTVRRGRRGEAGVDWTHADLRDRGQIDRLLGGVGAIVHLGELPNPDSAPFEELVATNAAICTNVLTAAADRGAGRIVYVSTAQVYGFCGRPNLLPMAAPATEEHPLRPTNAYALSKVNNERTCRYFGEWEGLSVAAVRPPHVVLPQTLDRWLRRAYDRPADEVVEFGCWVWHADASEAVARLLARPVEGFEAFNLAGPDLTNTHTLPEMLAAWRPGDLPPALADQPPPAVEGDSRQNLMSSAKLRGHLGWAPPTRMGDLVAAGAAVE